MTTTEIKTELNRAKEAKRAYKLAKDKADDYECLLIGGKSVRYDSDGSKSERKGNPIENAYCQLADYKAEADKLLKEMSSARERTERLINTVANPVQREVLTRRYIIGQRWEDIAESMNYSRQHVTRLHGYALKTLCLNVTFSP